MLQKLAESPGSRVVVTSSIAHKRGRIDFENLDAARGYNRFDFYAQSKLANALFMLELDKRLRAAGSPVSALGCHPGVAASELMRHVRIGPDRHPRPAHRPEPGDDGRRRVALLDRVAQPARVDFQRGAAVDERVQDRVVQLGLGGQLVRGDVWPQVTLHDIDVPDRIEQPGPRRTDDLVEGRCHDLGQRSAAHPRGDPPGAIGRVDPIVD